jgi:hypothetical protein
MNEQILSFIRTLVQSAAAALAAKGIIDAQGQTIIVAFVMWLIPTAWGLYVRRRNGLIQTVDALPGVGGVAVSPEIANQIASPTVTVIESLPAAVASAKP